MDFDPLLFFEPDQRVEVEENTVTIEKNEEIVAKNDITSQSESLLSEPVNDDESDNYIPLQVLDLPQTLNQIPHNVLCTLLKLFQPEQVKNFGNKTSPNPSLFSGDDLNDFLSDKSITLIELKELAVNLGQNIQSTLSLSQLPKSDLPNTTSYVTKIVSYPFLKYTEEERDQIYDLASYVMSANSAPALKGDTTRLVEIDGFGKDILLYEPALTEDKVGNITWGASLELAKQIVNKNTMTWLTHTETPILELGAGTGLVTIVLGMLKYKVMSTDLPEIVDNLEKNIKVNKLECSKSNADDTIKQTSLVHLTSLDWRSPDKFLFRTSTLSGYPVVLLSDPVYSPQHPYWVQSAVKAVLSKEANSRVVFMIGRRDRFQDVRDRMWSLMLELGLRPISSEIINGFDDYGVLQYDYKVFGW